MFFLQSFQVSGRPGFGRDQPDKIWRRFNRISLTSHQIRREGGFRKVRLHPGERHRLFQSGQLCQVNSQFNFFIVSSKKEFHFFWNILICNCICRINVIYKPVVQLSMTPSSPISELDKKNVTLYCDVISGNPKRLTMVKWFMEGALLKQVRITSNCVTPNIFHS